MAYIALALVALIVRLIVLAVKRVRIDVPEEHR